MVLGVWKIDLKSVEYNNIQLIIVIDYIIPVNNTSAPVCVYRDNLTGLTTSATRSPFNGALSVSIKGQYSRSLLESATIYPLYKCHIVGRRRPKYFFSPRFLLPAGVLIIVCIITVLCFLQKLCMCVCLNFIKYNSTVGRTEQTIRDCNTRTDNNNTQDIRKIIIFSSRSWSLEFIPRVVIQLPRGGTNTIICQLHLNQIVWIFWREKS